MTINPRFIFWLPRIICIIAILFISVFALDAFQPELTVWQQIQAFAMHLIPSFVLLLILIIAWVNFINLSTARALKRAKEVGVRKVVGAVKSQLATQFLLETFLAIGIISGDVSPKFLGDLFDAFGI